MAAATLEPSRVKNSARLDGVDLVRGLAILYVLLNHVNMRLFLAQIPYMQGLPPQLMSALFWNGQRGVQMFFAVSGFLITSTSLRRWSHFSWLSLQEFYQLRFARIAPLLLLLLAVLSLLHAAHFSDYRVKQETGGLSRALLAALTFHINVLEASRGYLPANWDVLWSLCVEEMFYLFFPLVLWALGRRKALVTVLLVFVALGPLARTVWANNNDSWQEYSYLGGMDAIAFGCLTALIVPKIKASELTRRLMGFGGAALLLLCLCFTRQAVVRALDHVGLDMTLIAIGTCLVMVAAVTTQWRTPPLLKPLVALGRCSYEIYLTHMFVVFAAFRLFLAAGTPMAGVPILFLTVVIVAGFLGAAVARTYSEPVNRWLRRRWGVGYAAGLSSMESTRSG